MSKYAVYISIVDTRSWDVEGDTPEQARAAALARYEQDGYSGSLLASYVDSVIAYDEQGHGYPDPELEDDDDDQ